MIYHFQEGAIEIETFDDRTLHMLELPGEECMLTITRERLPEGSTLEAFVDGAIGVVTRRLRRFELLGQERGTAGGAPSITWWCRWLHPQKKLMFQKHLQVLTQETVLTISVAGLAGSSEAVSAQVAAARKSLKLRRIQGAP
jgi:hypothetical protein